MIFAYIVGTLDVTELVFLAFVLFFIGLIVYLRREDRREGYPLEDEVTGRLESPGSILTDATPKSFLLPHGRGTVPQMRSGREPVDIPAKRAFGSIGAPYVPTGDPLVDGLGPASWAERRDVTDLTGDGRARIVPMSQEDHVAIATQDANPIGMPMLGADKKMVGPIKEVWIDRSEHVIRYLAVQTDTGKQVLVPMGMCVVKKGQGTIMCDALKAAQFENAPVPKSPNEITLYEEERVMAYFGGGYLYADAERQEPLI